MAIDFFLRHTNHLKHVACWPGAARRLCPLRNSHTHRMLKRAAVSYANQFGHKVAEVLHYPQGLDPLSQLKAWVVLGPPGVGKGTYSTRLASSLNIAHLSAGDLVREEMKLGTDYGKLVRASEGHCLSLLLFGSSHVTLPSCRATALPACLYFVDGHLSKRKCRTVQQLFRLTSEKLLISSNFRPPQPSTRASCCQTPSSLR